ncbi:MAG: carboxylating nicotinate-nucleotide diphosphorylase [Pseudomonadales bacterium]
MLDQTILDTAVKNNVAQALAEDVGGGDVSAMLIASTTISMARVITREAGIFCGQPWVGETMRQVDSAVAVTWHVTDGDQVTPEQALFELKGSARAMLTAERTMLNFAQLLSGTATRTARYANLIAPYKAVLLDTRKTIPGLRIAQKYAVACGGGQNHRIGLFDAFLLKENHINAAGSITAAINAARAAQPTLKLEVEVETLAQLDEAIAAGADIAMIDNFSLEDSVTAARRAAGHLLLEASGGINEQSITEIAATGVDYISIGDLTKTVTPLDLSMRFMD